MVSTGLFSLRNSLFAMDTGEGFIYFLHHMGSNAKTIKELILLVLLSFPDQVLEEGIFVPILLLGFRLQRITPE
jgi:hypothetical protein